MCVQQAENNAYKNSDTQILYYDVKLPVIPSVDASKSGLDAVLLQEDKPVAYVS